MPKKKNSKKATTPKNPKAKPDKPRRVSALDAATEVLRKSAKPMNCPDMITAMGEQGLWKSPGGKTPDRTLYAAILREVATKGKGSRFKKVERGQFEFVG